MFNKVRVRNLNKYVFLANICFLASEEINNSCRGTYYNFRSILVERNQYNYLYIIILHIYLKCKDNCMLLFSCKKLRYNKKKVNFAYIEAILHFKGSFIIT